MTEKSLSLAHWGAFRAQTSAGRLIAVSPFERDPHPSPLIRSVPEAVHAKSRITTPVIRKGYLDHGPGRAAKGRGTDAFVPVSWDDALALVAHRIADVRTKDGNQAIFGGSYGWASAGRVNHARTLLHRFLNCIGGHVGQATNYSWGAAAILLPHILGNYETVSGPLADWASIARHTQLMVLFGGANPKNAFVTSGGAGAHEFESWLKRARDAGVNFVVVSPNKSDAPDFLQSEWLPIKPNTDTAFMLGLAHTLVREHSANADFLSRFCVGYERVQSYLTGEQDGTPKSAEWAAGITGIDADTIRNLAERMAGSRTMLTATWSLQRADHGEQPYWMLITLAAMLGQIGLPGCGFGFGYGSINGMGSPRHRIPTPTMKEGTNPVELSIPVARLTDLLLHPGEAIDFNGTRIALPEIRLVYWAGGNPFHHHQDLHRLRKAWSRPETIVVHEPWWTATARHADIVLPATTPFERDDIGSSPRDRYLIAMRQLISPIGEARNDFDIFSDLARRLGAEEHFTEGRDIRGWIRHLYDVHRENARKAGLHLPDFETFWTDGFVELPAPQQDFVPFADFRRDPESHPLSTPSGKIELYSQTIADFGYDDCAGHAMWLPPTEWLGASLSQRYPLHLLTPQPSTRLHSQLDDGPVSTQSKIQGREPIWINPDDARVRGIASGDVVRVYNERGACLAGAIVTDTIRPQVVLLATGAWFDPLDPVAERPLDKHGNPNVLTRDAGTSRLGQGCSAQSTLVEIERWDRPIPAITAFDRPPLAGP